MAALDEQPLRVGLLEKAGADLFGGDVRGQRQHGGAGALRVVQALKQMRVPRPTATRAHRQPSGQLGLGGSRERRRFLVAHMDPFDALGAADRVDQWIEAVADQAVDPFDTDLPKGIDQLVSNCWSAHGHPSVILPQGPGCRS